MEVMPPYESEVIPEVEGVKAFPPAFKLIMEQVN